VASSRSGFGFFSLVNSSPSCRLVARTNRRCAKTGHVGWNPLCFPSTDAWCAATLSKLPLAPRLAPRRCVEVNYVCRAVIQQVTEKLKENWLCFANFYWNKTISSYAPSVLLLIPRTARWRRATARRSYRSSFSSSGKARRTASARRSASADGIVPAASTGVGSFGSPRSHALKNAVTCRTDSKSCGCSNWPNANIRSISATFACRTRAMPNSASAAARAYSRITKSVASAAIFRAS